MLSFSSSEAMVGFLGTTMFTKYLKASSSSPGILEILLYFKEENHSEINDRINKQSQKTERMNACYHPQSLTSGISFHCARVHTNRRA
mmetsp:Transcript_25553/g.55981  ORF Transcript_25553/g.55981 Transcript_25553/m.55981 type:complete len:88 (-) Transcript_25553:152-415(-)